MSRASYVLLSILWASAATATEESPLSALIDSAVMLSGYERPTTTLTVQMVSPDEMSQMVCRGRSNCRIYAAYRDSDVLYLRTDLGDPDLSDHLRFHEIVHWLQDHNGKFKGTDCTTLVNREREAYRLENRFIIEVQHGIALMVIPPYDCPMPPSPAR